MSLLRKYVTMFREDMREVMSRRCGLDELNNFIMLLGFIFISAALFTKKPLIAFIGGVLVVLCYVRVFSKNLDKRRKENAFYMRYMGSIVEVCRYVKLCLKMKIKTMRDGEYAYFVCRTCRQIIRVPKGKNKVNIRCPKCSQTFIRRT
ncbi:MAG: hypothetical protein NC300_00355 [Bacteroidales bacterium]|nr:hypothetical protein [Clostridium sp.]MCM1202574.1 hypothetical protein [Bacteroidales bacterium]